MQSWKQDRSGLAKRGVLKRLYRQSQAFTYLLAQGGPLRCHLAAGTVKVSKERSAIFLANGRLLWPEDPQVGLKSGQTLVLLLETLLDWCCRRSRLWPVGCRWKSSIAPRVLVKPRVLLSLRTSGNLSNRSRLRSLRVRPGRRQSSRLKGRPLASCMHLFDQDGRAAEAWDLRRRRTGGAKSPMLWASRLEYFDLPALGKSTCASCCRRGTTATWPTTRNEERGDSGSSSSRERERAAACGRARAVVASHHNGKAIGLAGLQAGWSSAAVS